MLSSHGIYVSQLLLPAFLEGQLELDSKKTDHLFLCSHYFDTGQRSPHRNPGPGAVSEPLLERVLGIVHSPTLGLVVFVFVVVLWCSVVFLCSVVVAFSYQVVDSRTRDQM